jgi:hypothetical protein
MTEPPEPKPTIATMRTIGFVWIGVGVAAVLGGAVATVFAVAVFGILAVLLGAGLVGIQHMRARSAIRASRTLTNSPVPPADPPSANPGPPGPPPGAYDPGPTTSDDESEAPVGSSGGDGGGDGGGDEGYEPSTSEQDEDDPDDQDGRRD